MKNSIFFVSIKTVLFIIYYYYHAGCSQDFTRGLNPSNKDYYTATGDFGCLDGSKSIPFDRINDDYCDCNDGSDEPGTAACPNGVFYCTNKDYRPIILPSNRVSDGVCDCCDGSDEYTGEVQCQNKCMELGQQLKVDEERKYIMFVAGNELYKEYCQEGSAAKQQFKDKLMTLENEKEQLENERADHDSVVKKLETPEVEAKDTFKKAWEVSRDQRREERKKKKALEIFHELDIDLNGKVSLEELKLKPELDTDGDGEVSNEECVEHMGGDEDSMEFITFYERAWENIDQMLKNKFQQNKKEQSLEETPQSTPSEEDDEEERKDEEEEEEDDTDVDNEDGDEEKKDEDEAQDSIEDDEEMPPYDEDTQKYIDAAESARTMARDSENKLNNINNEIEHATKIIDSDYGPNNEFYSLLGQCMELTDREYLYKLCPFDSTTQRNKNGGSETSLGYWTHWEDSNYRRMVYEKGQGCWNGPDRSTKVSIECGRDNKLLSAEEPSRCEYHFSVSTPAACRDAPHHETTSRQEL